MTIWTRRQRAVVGVAIAFAAEVVVNVLGNLSGVWLPVVTGATLIVFVWLGWPYWGRWRALLWPSTEFYSDAREKEIERGSLYREIAETDRLWMAFESGVFFEREDLETARGNIERVLLLDPDGEYIPLYHRRQDADIGIDDLRGKIRRATDYIMGAEIPVRWYDGHLMNCVIGEPHTDRTWVRIHYQIPHHYRSMDWPDFIVRRGNRAALIERLQDSFDRMWDVAVIPRGYETGARAP